MQGLYIQSQMIKLKDERVLMAAMEDPRWKAVGAKVQPVTLEKFADRVNIEQPPRTTNFIIVSFVDNSKEAKNARPAGRRLRHQGLQGDLRPGRHEADGREDRDLSQRGEPCWTGRSSACARTTTCWARTAPTTSRSSAPTTTRPCVTQATLNDARELLQQAKQEREQAEQAAGGRKFTVEDFARVDPEMAGQVQGPGRGPDALRHAAGVARPEATPPSSTPRAVLEARIERMEEYADELNEKFVIRWKVDGSGGALISKDLADPGGQHQAAGGPVRAARPSLVADMRGRAKKISQNHQPDQPVPAPAQGDQRPACAT